MFRSPFSPAAAQNKSDSGYMKGPQTADTWGQLSDANFPKVGQIVQLRTRTYYLVDDVIRSPEIVFGTLVRLVCVDDDAQGQPLEVILKSDARSSFKTFTLPRYWLAP
jgi:hypothetical protein